MVLKIGRLCMKIAGRDSRNKCVIVDVVDDTYVLIDGQVRRKKCNIKHLEPLNQVLEIKKGAAHEEVVQAFKKLNIEIRERKSKEKTERPRKQRKRKEVMKEETKKHAKKGKDISKKEINK